ncbi:MAG: zf-TFIIB domain-containing protein [Candidatus Omnitrophica bacterium]|nr:zf-TFIIB domain-containing protein [Candidatus Omnitrophota bacterium]
MLTDQRVLKKNLTCPKCNLEMDLVESNGTRISECFTCGGTWVNRAEEKQVLNMKPIVFTQDDFLNFRRTYRPLLHNEKVRYFKCPCCANLMYRKQFMHGSGIVVDNCSLHGTFFDKGKLQKAMEFIEKGGVEYARISLNQREMEELRTKLFVGINRIEANLYRFYWLSKT